jgi:hypothetical protein
MFLKNTKMCRICNPWRRDSTRAPAEIRSRRWNAERVGPGHSAVTVTPVPAISAASPSENESTYALEA